MTAFVTATINCDAGIGSIPRSNQCDWWFEADEGAWRQTVKLCRKAAHAAGWRQVVVCFNEGDESKSRIDLCPSCYAEHKGGDRRA